MTGTSWMSVALLGLLIVGASAAYLTVRLMGAHAVDSDHPSARTRPH